MPIAILDPFSGIAGDMTLGALVAAGLDPEWLRALPQRLGLDGVTVRIATVQRASIACTKVDFEIPPQGHGRHLRQIRALLEAARLPPDVQRLADAAFDAITRAEGEIHGIAPERVHLHEVGAVDAILDVVGSIWGFRELGVTAVYCGPIRLGDGTVMAAHGELPVPAPATLRLLIGHAVRPGPEGSGELVTPTGAALVRVLSQGPPPAEYVPLSTGFGAGTKDFPGRPNALRVIIADASSPAGITVQSLVHLETDIDDMSGEYLSDVAATLRRAGALDVTIVPLVMKKGRPAVRLEVLAAPRDADALRTMLFSHTTSIGLRRTLIERHALAREERTVELLGETIRIKVVTLPDGTRRAKPELDDVCRLASATGLAPLDVAARAAAAARPLLEEG
ncbi:MAG: nickel pincer cofactor biosynthesis protein LarC [Gemmatimonadota bacterium]|nr:nickel pincer cofactor biosynthesis protein LarC [Gemmatimonadota bacterium]